MGTTLGYMGSQVPQHKQASGGLFDWRRAGKVLLVVLAVACCATAYGLTWRSLGSLRSESRSFRREAEQLRASAAVVLQAANPYFTPGDIVGHRGQ